MRSPLDAFARQEISVSDSLPELTANRIREMITSGKLTPGSQLPNEIELADAMGVSRGTIRSALSLLQQQGLIWRRQGLGSFVSENPILRNRLDINLGVTDLIKSMGLHPGGLILEIAQVQADKHLSRLLEIPMNSPLISIKRIRTADSKPVVASTDILPAMLLGNSPTKMTLADLRNQLEEKISLYRILESVMGVALEYGIASLRPVKMAARSLKDMGLDLPSGTVMLYLEQVDYDRNRRPMVVSYEYHVAEFCEFTIYRRH